VGLYVDWVPTVRNNILSPSSAHLPPLDHKMCNANELQRIRNTCVHVLRPPAHLRHGFESHFKMDVIELL
jgi:hypothetical protein